VAAACQIAASPTPQPATAPPGTPAATPAPAAKTLVIAIQASPDNLFSLVQNNRQSGDVQSFIHRRLMEVGQENELGCVLCEEVPSLQNGLWEIDEGSGAMALTYKLKKGLTWADGREITTRDFLFAHELSTDEQYEYGPSYIKPISGIEALDDYTLIVRYSTLYPFALNDATSKIGLVPEHIYRPIWEEYRQKGGEYWKAFTSDERVSRKPLGNGPYAVQEWITDSSITLVRNPNYNVRAQPTIGTIVVRIIPDTNTMTVNIATRQTQLVDGWITIEQAGGLKSAQGVNVLFLPVSWLEHATLQINQPPLDDKRVRQALLFGMDRQAISDGIFLGEQLVAESWLPPDSPAFNPDVPKYPYDPERAKALLDEAGWKLGSDGIRRNSAGEPLSITYIAISGDKTREQVAAVIQANWKELGLDVRIEPQTTTLLFSETIPMNQLQPGGLAVWRWVLGKDVEFMQFWKPDPGSFDLLYPDSVWGKVTKHHDLVDKAMSALDPAERYEFAKQEQLIFMEELPILPIYFHTRVASVDASLSGYAPFADASIGWNVETWELR
jgi:peptide/nickel transport system substrate-binding protein